MSCGSSRDNNINHAEVDRIFNKNPPPPPPTIPGGNFFVQGHGTMHYSKQTNWKIFTEIKNQFTDKSFTQEKQRVTHCSLISTIQIPIILKENFENTETGKKSIQN